MNLPQLPVFITDAILLGVTNWCCNVLNSKFSNSKYNLVPILSAFYFSYWSSLLGILVHTIFGNILIIPWFHEISKWLGFQCGLCFVGVEYWLIGFPKSWISEYLNDTLYLILVQKFYTF